MLCPCCSGKRLTQCCGPLLAGQQHARTVKQLMRSRFSAFALGGHGDYLLASWHPSTRPDIDAQTLGQRDTHWIRLMWSTLHRRRTWHRYLLRVLAG